MASNNNQINVTFKAFNKDFNNKMSEMNAETARAKREMQLMQEQLQANGTQSEKLIAKLKGLERQQELASEKTRLAREQLDQVRATFGANSNEARRLEDQVMSLSIAEQRLANQVTKANQDIEKHEKATRSLNSTLQLVEGSVDDFADALGEDLTKALNDGTANAKQIEKAIEIIGRSALGAEVDVTRLRTALREIDNGANVNAVREDLQRLATEASEAEKSVDGLKDKISGLGGGLVAGVGIAGIVEKSLDVSSLNTKIAVSFDVPPESVASIEQAIKKIDAYGVEGEEALEGVRRQWALNKDASDETNRAIVEGAAVITKSYAGIDFIELIQETNEIASSLKITNEEALALTNSLLKFGFPPEQLDTIAEYGLQMQAIGFSTAEIQAIFEKGVDTKTWNIDNLNDGVKEARITMSEFGLEVDKSTAALLNGTGISAKQLNEWGKAVASGGEEGAAAMGKVSEWLKTIEDDALRNELAIKVFGTKAEDQVGNMIAVFEGLADVQSKTVENQNSLQDAINQYNTDPLVRVKDAINQVMQQMKPKLEMVANITATIASWVANNSTLAATIVSVVAVIGILTGAFAALMPAIGALITSWPLIAGGLSAALSPIALAVVAIGAIGAALVALWKNSETFRTNITLVFEAIKAITLTVFEAIVSFIGEKIAQILQFWQTNGAQILQAAENAFNGIKAVIDFVMPAIKLGIETVWNAIKNIIDGALNIIMGAIKAFSGLLTGDFKGMWEGIKQIFKGAIELIVGWVSLSFVGGIRTLLTNLSKTAINLIKTKWTTILSTFKSASSNAVSTVKTMVSSVIQFVKNLATNFISTISKMKDDVVKKMVEIKDGIVNKVKEVDLVQIGKDIISGLIKGISSMTSNAIESITGVVNGVINKAKNLLGIHSPSRVFMGIGSDTVEGMEKGMSGRQKRLNAVMTDLTNNLLDVTDHYKSEDKKIISNANVEIEKIEKKTNESINKIYQTARKKKRTISAEENKKIQQLKSDAAKKISEIEKKATKESVALISKEQKDKLEEIKLFIQDKKSLNEMSLLDEAYLWEKAMNQFDMYSKERIEAQKAYKTAVDAINKEVVSINTEFEGKIQAVHENYIQKENQLNEQLKSALDSRASTLVNFKGTFDEFTIDLEKKGEVLLHNLQSQVDGFKRWQSEFGILSSKKGISKNLLNELGEMGPNALSELIALNQLTDEQLSRYSSLYEEKARLARQQAEKELAPLKASTEQQITALRQSAEQELTKLQAEWRTKIKGVVKATDDELISLKTVGENAGKGLLQGLSNTAPAIQKKTAEIAESIKKTIKHALDIHSPSRVTYGFGVNVNEGFVQGLDKTKSKIQKVMSNIYDKIPVDIKNIAKGIDISSQIGAVDMGNINSMVSHNISNDVQPVIQIEPAPIILNGKTIGYATYDTINNLRSSATKMTGISKGVRMNK